MSGGYAAAGVDIDAKAAMLERLRGRVEATHGPEVEAAVGPFAGLYRTPGGDLLAASTDSVGTKVKVAVAAGRHRGIGQDIVHHCLNDVATAGARPLFFLDYFATGALDPAVFSAVMEGLVDACGEAGCALIGGETAEMPGVYAGGDYDLAGFAVGLVEPERRPRPDLIRPGDLLVGLPSSGLHTNGYSLVRKLFAQIPLAEVVPQLGRPLADVLLEPHRSYVAELGAVSWKSAAHITGGGFFDNIPRCLPAGLGARIYRGAWTPPAVFTLIAERGELGPEEMFGTFNMGIGMVLVRSDPLPGLPVVGEVVEASGSERVVLA